MSRAMQAKARLVVVSTTWPDFGAPVEEWPHQHLLDQGWIVSCELCGGAVLGGGPSTLIQPKGITTRRPYPPWGKHEQCASPLSEIARVVGLDEEATQDLAGLRNDAGGLVVDKARAIGYRELAWSRQQWDEAIGADTRAYVQALRIGHGQPEAVQDQLPQRLAGSNWDRHVASSRPIKPWSFLRAMDLTHIVGRIKRPSPDGSCCYRCGLERSTRWLVDPLGRGYSCGFRVCAPGRSARLGPHAKLVTAYLRASYPTSFTGTVQVQDVARLDPMPRFWFEFPEAERPAPSRQRFSWITKAMVEAWHDQMLDIQFQRRDPRGWTRLQNERAEKEAREKAIADEVARQLAEKVSS